MSSIQMISLVSFHQLGSIQMISLVSFHQHLLYSKWYIIIDYLPDVQGPYLSHFLKVLWYIPFLLPRLFHLVGQSNILFFVHLQISYKVKSRTMITKMSPDGISAYFLTLPNNNDDWCVLASFTITHALDFYTGVILIGSERNKQR